ncbi:hypothetical protein [Paenibacillus sp. FSL H8-0168]|uniref:hypothetical protein n=1 Tax=Paenibacillus sp. FSL H8-0168 TaxID=2921378 RepID=UPI00315805EE
MNKQEIARIAAETALEFYKKEQERQNKLKRDRRLRNTKMLLRNYRKFKIHCGSNVQELEELKDPDSFEYLDTDDLAIEAIIKNKERTAAMVSYIDRMLDVYQILSEKSKKPEDIRRFKILFDLYVSEQEKTVEDLSDCHKINKRSIYRDINKACEAFSSLLFGVDGIRLIS